MGFQPVSGFGDETGPNPNGPVRARTIAIRTLQEHTYFVSPSTELAGPFAL
jgi:hypothetical protein